MIKKVSKVYVKKEPRYVKLESVHRGQEDFEEEYFSADEEEHASAGPPAEAPHGFAVASKSATF